MSECPHYNNYNSWCEKSGKEIDYGYAKYNCLNYYLKCPTYMDDDYQGEGSSGGGCYLTTAMCEILGKEDNCYELDFLRDFRDNYLLKHTSTSYLVYEYYKLSPPLSQKLKKSPKRQELALIMLNDYINPLIAKIKEKEYMLAINMYKSMYSHLATELENN